MTIEAEEFDYPETNYNKVQNMNIEELAAFMNECGHDFPPYCDYKEATTFNCDYNCLKCAEQWLKRKVDMQ